MLSGTPADRSNSATLLPSPPEPPEPPELRGSRRIPPAPRDVAETRKRLDVAGLTGERGVVECFGARVVARACRAGGLAERGPKIGRYARARLFFGCYRRIELGQLRDV